jgi:hypothetical protein
MENNTFKCPKDGCGKNFRKENLLQVSNITIQLNKFIYTVILYISYYGDMCQHVLRILHISLLWNYTMLQFLMNKIIQKSKIASDANFLLILLLLLFLMYVLYSLMNHIFCVLYVVLCFSLKCICF